MPGLGKPGKPGGAASMRPFALAGQGLLVLLLQPVWRQGIEGAVLFDVGRQHIRIYGVWGIHGSALGQHGVAVAPAFKVIDQGTR